MKQLRWASGSASRLFGSVQARHASTLVPSERQASCSGMSRIGFGCERHPLCAPESGGLWDAHRFKTE
jgi:hypothetical protein